MHNSTVVIGIVFEKAQYNNQTRAVNSHYATTALSTPASYGELSLVALPTLKVEDHNFPTYRKQNAEMRTEFLYFRIETNVGLL
jgi:hypothetical protein